MIFLLWRTFTYTNFQIKLSCPKLYWDFETLEIRSDWNYNFKWWLLNRTQKEKKWTINESSHVIKMCCYSEKKPKVIGIFGHTKTCLAKEISMSKRQKVHLYFFNDEKSSLRGKKNKSDFLMTFLYLSRYLSWLNQGAADVKIQYNECTQINGDTKLNAFESIEYG